MDKKKLVVKSLDVQWDSVTFQDQVIKVKKMLSPYDMMTLVKAYLTEYFSGDMVEEQIVFAELSFKSVLFDVATDHSLENADFDKLLVTPLFDDIILKIVNISDARRAIEKAIEKKSKEHSLEASFANITSGIMGALEHIGDMNINKETVEAVAQTVKEARALDFGNISKPMPKKRKIKKA